MFRPYLSPHSPTTELNAEEVQAQTDEFFRRVYKLSKQYREDLVVANTKEMVEAFRHLLPLVTEACNPAMQPHHWEQVRGGGTKERVGAFRHLLPLVTEACNPAKQPHRWEQVRGGGQGEGGAFHPEVPGTEPEASG